MPRAQIAQRRQRLLADDREVAQVDAHTDVPPQHVAGHRGPRPFVEQPLLEERRRARRGLEQAIGLRLERQHAAHAGALLDRRERAGAARQVARHAPQIGLGLAGRAVAERQRRQRQLASRGHHAGTELGAQARVVQPFFGSPVGPVDGGLHHVVVEAIEREHVQRPQRCFGRGHRGDQPFARALIADQLGDQRHRPPTAEPELAAGCARGGRDRRRMLGQHRHCRRQIRCRVHVAAVGEPEVIHRGRRTIAATSSRSAEEGCGAHAPNADAEGWQSRPTAPP